MEDFARSCSLLLVDSVADETMNERRMNCAAAVAAAVVAAVAMVVAAAAAAEVGQPWQCD